MARAGRFILPIAAVVSLAAGAAIAGELKFTVVDPEKLPCGVGNGIEAIVWAGDDTRMTLARLAAYCAPVLWFSPDEPLLDREAGISIPQAFPFEDSVPTPVVYYRVRNILERNDARGTTLTRGTGGRDSAVIDLANVAGIDLDFFFYYPSEAGLGVHRHDVESAELQLLVWRRDNCPQ